jgi:hypothetical protein
MDAMLLSFDANAVMNYGYEEYRKPSSLCQSKRLEEIESVIAYFF